MLNERRPLPLPALLGPYDARPGDTLLVESGGVENFNVECCAIGIGLRCATGQYGFDTDKREFQSSKSLVITTKSCGSVSLHTCGAKVQLKSLLDRGAVYFSFLRRAFHLTDDDAWHALCRFVADEGIDFEVVAIAFPAIPEGRTNEQIKSFADRLAARLQQLRRGTQATVFGVISRRHADEVATRLGSLVRWKLHSNTGSYVKPGFAWSCRTIEPRQQARDLRVVAPQAR
jgi:hypothetical protein